MKIKILIADDHQLFRDGIENLLSNSDAIQIIGQAATGKETLKLVKDLLPDIVLLDIGMPEMNGIQAAEKISKDFPDVRIIALSMYADKMNVKKMLESGAMAYLFKDCTYSQLIEAIQLVHSGKRFLSSTISDLLINDYLGVEDEKNKESDLSDREYEVLKLIAEGCTTREIAEKLFVSVKTIGTHKQNILEKLDLKTNADIIKYSLKNGLIAL